VSGVHRRADRITVDLSAGGGTRSIEWEHVADDVIALPGVGDALVLRPTRPRFFPLAG
jgi:hypothetical protein